MDRQIMEDEPSEGPQFGYFRDIINLNTTFAGFFCFSHDGKFLGDYQYARDCCATNWQAFYRQPAAEPARHCN